MTEDTSPENLRKFLESDDPAMVRMGISLAKGVGVEITVKDLEHFLKSEEVETIKTGVMLADEVGIGDEAMDVLCEPLEDDDFEVRRSAAERLGKLDDKRAVGPLIIKLEGDGYEYTAEMDGWNRENMDELREKAAAAAAEALGKIGDERAVEPLIDVISSDNEWSPEDKYGEDWRLIRDRAAWALGKIGDARAIDTLIMALALETEAEVRWSIVGALGKFVSAKTVGPIVRDNIISELTHVTRKDWNKDVRRWAVETLRNVGHEVDYQE